MRATAANCATSAGHVTSKASATPRTPCARLAPPVSPWTRPPSRHRPQKPPRKKDPRKRRRERKRRRTKRPRKKDPRKRRRERKRRRTEDSFLRGCQRVRRAIRLVPG